MPVELAGERISDTAFSQQVRWIMCSMHNEGFGYFNVYVEENLSPDWQQTFSGVTVQKVASGTCIEVYCKDMSELHGIMNLVFNMGLKLQAVIKEGFSVDV